MKPKLHVGIAWDGLPYYAARCIRALLAKNLGPVTIVGTKAKFPIENIEESVGQGVHWIQGNERKITWGTLNASPPDLFIQGGYYRPAFMRLGEDCRINGGHVVLSSDHNWIRTWRQRFLDPFRLQILLKKNFDAVFVAGKSGRHFFQKMGVSSERIYSGLLSADPEMFRVGNALSRRPKCLVFVGQLIRRKNILTLCDVVVALHERYPEWKLLVYGAGDLANALPSHPAIALRSFAQPYEVAAAMRSARCLVLPSHQENWGLVVHEAALSGCALALSHQVGAAEDLAGPANSVTFSSKKKHEIAAAIEELYRWDDERWDYAGRVSFELSSKFNPHCYANAIEKMAHDICAT